MDCSTPDFPVLHLSPGVCSNSCPLSQLCRPTISSSFVPFSSCLQSFPASGSFLVSWLFASGGQSIGASAPVLPMSIQGWFPLGLASLISLQSKGLKSLLQHHSSKASFFQRSAFFMVQLSHPYVTTRRMTTWTFVRCVISLLFDMLSRFVIAFLPRSKHLLILWLQSICSDFVAQENEIQQFPLFPYLFAIKWWDQMPWSSIFECWVLSQLFNSPLSLSSRGSLVLRFLP